MDRLKFPHLENLDRIPTFLASVEYVTVTEKIDGFNARFGRGLDGEFWVGSRNREIDPEKEPLQGFAAFALSRADEVPVGVTIFGEWAGKGIQKRIDYGEPSFYLFDGHFGTNRESVGNWFDPDDLAEYAFHMGLARVPTVYEGPPPSVAQLDEWRRREGSEGIVIRAYPMLLDKYGHPTIAKFKNPAFEERTSRREDRVVDIEVAQKADAFAREYVTAERLTHVLQAVAEAGWDGENAPDPLDPRLTGPVLRTMYEDVVREGADDFAALSEDAQKAVGKLIPRLAKPLLDDARLAALETAAA